MYVINKSSVGSNAILSQEAMGDMHVGINACNLSS